MNRELDERNIPKCPKCREWIANLMFQPLRCPGLSYNKDGRSFVGRESCPSFRWWDEVVKEHEDEHKAAILAFWDANASHLMDHGYRKPVFGKQEAAP